MLLETVWFCMWLFENVLFSYLIAVSNDLRPVHWQRLLLLWQRFPGGNAAAAHPRRRRLRDGRRNRLLHAGMHFHDRNGGMWICKHTFNTHTMHSAHFCTHFELSHFARRSFLGISSSFFPEFDYREAGKSFFNSKLWAKSYYLLGVFYCISIKMASNSNKSMKKDTSLTQTRTRFT